MYNQPLLLILVMGQLRLISVWFLHVSVHVCLHNLTVCAELILISKPRMCICPGDIVTYKCSVMSEFGEATVFEGNSFACSEDADRPKELILHHSDGFNESEQTTCNNGTVVGQDLNIENGTYTSRLNITVTSELIGDIIECRHINGNIEGQSTINNTAFSQNNKMHITNIDFQSSQLTFHWNPVAPECSDVHYNINASNCGSCPTTTHYTTVTCTDIPWTNGICMFSVKSVFCGSLVTNQSDMLNITLNSAACARLEKGCIGLAASTGFLAILLSVSVVTFSTVISILLKQKRAKTPDHVTPKGVTRRVRAQSPVYDEMESVHPLSHVYVTIDTKQNIAYSCALKH